MARASFRWGVGQAPDEPAPVGEKTAVFTGTPKVITTPGRVPLEGTTVLLVLGHQIIGTAVTGRDGRAFFQKVPFTFGFEDLLEYLVLKPGTHISDRQVIARKAAVPGGEPTIAVPREKAGLLPVKEEPSKFPTVPVIIGGVLTLGIVGAVLLGVFDSEPEDEEIRV